MKTWFLCVVLTIALAGVSCEKKNPTLFEDAGKNMDQEIHKAGEKIDQNLNKAGEKVKDATH